MTDESAAQTEAVGSDEEELHALTVDPAEAGGRLDKWLATVLPELSRSRLKGLIEEGCLEDQGGPVTDVSRKVKAGETFWLAVPPSAAADPLPEPLDLVVVYEDEHLIVIDKPAGMVVHPAPGNPSGTLVNGLLHHCAASLSGIGGVKRPGIVHRIDKDTSGLIVAAKTDAAHHGLAAQFADHSIDRAYRALCWGVPIPGKGVVEGNIGRSTADRKKMAVVAWGGKKALTRYKVEKAFGAIVAQIECRLATGRTHQIRVHMAHLGHPLVGDPVYGLKRPPKDAPAIAKSLPRQALHATQVTFLHPLTKTEMCYSSSVPEDMANLIAGMS